MYHADSEFICIVGRIDGNFLSVDENLSLIGIIDAGEHVHQGRLAASVFAEQCKNLTAVDIKRAVIVRDDGTKCFGDVAHGDRWYSLIHSVFALSS